MMAMIVCNRVSCGYYTEIDKTETGDNRGRCKCHVIGITDKGCDSYFVMPDGMKELGKVIEKEGG